MVAVERKKKDFYWTDGGEPHAIRRKAILAKYPQIKELYGSDLHMPLMVTVEVLIQAAMLFYVRHLTWPWLVLVTYVVSGTINHSLLLAIHELAHNLAFGHNHATANKVFSIFANLPMGLPLAVSYKKYHMEHHRYQGTDGLDVDLPTPIEARLFSSTLGKIVWLMILPITYFLRPVFIRPKPFSVLEIANIVVQLSADALVYHFLGGKALFYLLGGFMMGLGLHPMSGHLISEHYIFNRGNETYSYYGWMNMLTFNEGYHNEHHDFPAVPGSRLPMVSKIAPEFYKDLPTHDSWVGTLVNFVLRDDVSPYSRIKREKKANQGRVDLYN
ncbi:sphingolipid delta(4)-desaturase DES1-like [Pollicipes pollicipes]|uniref:sphingolipid delta(4)-desaturase DES1-like n=1 Tax=Pollicipes pollicipes TaxID=41117 RepID=UPI001884C427|nr:sphingolipid delta(4)-desaturase DES1-like [Pollicipes pollicipes]